MIAQLRELLADEADELVLSPAVELEILREPQHAAVAQRREELERAMDVLEATPETFSLAADAMERLAAYEANAHRRPVVDLVTAALAHQHHCGIIHHDGDYEIIAEKGGLAVSLFRITLDEEAAAGAVHPARRQRQLRTELAGLIHQLPVAEAEELLDAIVRQARERVASAGRPQQSS